jgi:hypothetical protein
MGSFGLPALSIKPQQQESPLEAFARIQQLRGLAQQQQGFGAEISTQRLHKLASATAVSR